MNFPINYDGVCRTCLRKAENLADLFSVGKTNMSLSSAIMECAPVHILPGDGMPTQICSECIDKLQISHRFREMCLQADRTMRQYLQAITGGPPMNTHIPPMPPQPQLHNPHPHMKQQQLIPEHHQQHHQPVPPPPQQPYEMPVKVELVNEEQDHGQLQYLPPPVISKPLVKDQMVLGSEMKIETPSQPAEQKRFSCDVCEKSFPVNNALIKHYRIHSGERPYKCNICGKDFNCSSTLSVHIRFHNNDRRFKCSLCDKSYVVKSHLTVHMRSHTGEHPYSCHVCDKRFRISKSLTRHLKNNTCDRVVNEFTLQKYGVTM